MSNLVIRKNLYPHPLTFSNMDTNGENKGTEWSVEDGVMTVTQGTATKPYVAFWMEDMPPEMS